MNKFFSTMRTTVMAAVGVASISVVLMSCFKDKHNENNNIPVAGLMAFNLAPDKSAVGFSLSGNNLTNSPLGYTSFTGGYVSVYPGQRTVDAYDSYTIAGKLSTVTGNFVADKYYSVFLMGADSSYRNVLVSDNIDTLSAASGKAFIRYVNAVPDSISTPLITVTSGGNNVVNSPLTFSGVSEFIPVNPGEVSFAAKNAAGIDVNRTISVEQKKVYTILLLGLPGSTTTPVEIKYITNGTLSDDPAKNSSAIGTEATIN